MSLLLATDEVRLYRLEGEDAHGWSLPRGEPVWCGQGNLQLGPGPSDPRASEGGGHGPFSPGAHQAGVLFLPPEASPAEGMAAVIRGQVFALGQVRLVRDPEQGAWLDCWACTATEAPHG